MVFDTEHLELLLQKFAEIEGIQRVTRWVDDNESMY